MPWNTQWESNLHDDFGVGVQKCTCGYLLTWARTFFICMVCTRVKLVRIAPQTEARRGLVSTAIFFSISCHHVGCLSCCSSLYDKPLVHQWLRWLPYCFQLYTCPGHNCNFSLLLPGNFAVLIIQVGVACFHSVNIAGWANTNRKHTESACEICQQQCAPSLPLELLRIDFIAASLCSKLSEWC